MNTKIAIVTGGNAGLGLAIAQVFCKNNIKTYIIGRNEEKTRTACMELGQNAIPVICDMANLSEIPNVVKNIVDLEGKIDILVNNAGINLKKNFEEVSDEDFQNIIQVNLSSVFSISREVVKNMKSNGSGAIVNISSMAAIYGLPRVIAYTASKSAIEGMTRAMAVELSPLGIRVNCVAPGFIKTSMTDKALNDDPERKNKVLSRTPMQALGMPSDIGEAVYFLCSENAKFITGVILPVDGGNSIGF